MLRGFVLTVFQYDGESFTFENHLGTVSLPIANVRRKPVVEFIKKVYNPNNKKAQLIHCIYFQEIKFMFHF